MNWQSIAQVDRSKERVRKKEKAACYRSHALLLKNNIFINPLSDYVPKTVHSGIFFRSACGRIAVTAKLEAGRCI